MVDLTTSDHQQDDSLATGWFASLFPRRFRTRERVLVTKLDVFLMSWAFVAGITKDMDQSATTQACAYNSPSRVVPPVCPADRSSSSLPTDVSGMKEVRRARAQPPPARAER